jgi:hypothetical protein
MLIPVFAFLSLIVLRLTTRARWKTIMIASLVIGVVADTALDLLVSYRR